MGESAGEGGNQEGVKAIAGIVELLQRRLAGSHNAFTLGKKQEKKTLGVELCSRFTAQKIWGDNKYSNDSSVPQPLQPKLTTGPNAECQQQTQRSGLRGAG